MTKKKNKSIVLVKRILAVGFAFSMLIICGSVQADAKNIAHSLSDTAKTDGVLPAENLRWSEEIPGMAVFDNPNDSKVSFVLHWFEDGQKERVWHVSAQRSGEVTLPVYSEIYESGTYTFQVETFAYDAETDYDLSSGCVSEISPEFIYTRPDTQLSAPSDIKGIDGIVKWDNVEHARVYWCYVYRTDKNADDGKYYLVSGGTADRNMYGKGRMEDGYNYFIKVRAVSENINLYANSKESDYVMFGGSQ